MTKDVLSESERLFDRITDDPQAEATALIAHQLALLTSVLTQVRGATDDMAGQLLKIREQLEKKN